MFKKLVSKALLSVVMDKNARDNLGAGKKRKPAPKPGPRAPEPAAPSKGLKAGEPKAGGLKAGEPKAGASPSPPPPMAETEDTHQLIMDSLRAAEQELTEKRDMTPERQVLIRQAMAMHHSKAHILNDLSQEDREKLYVVALKTIQGEPEKAAPRLAPRPKKAKK